MPDVTLTVDGQKITAPAGTLLIDACKANGIQIPAFCYYPGLSLQAACRMCVVRIEKMPKLQTACTTPVAEGMVVKLRCSSYWAITRLIAQCAMPADNANCRT